MHKMRHVYKQLLHDKVGDMKETWKILNNLLGKSNNKSNFSDCFMIDDKKDNNFVEIATGFQ